MMFAASSAAARPVDMMVPEHVTAPVPAAVNSNIIFLNRCAPNGCTVTQGATDSRTDHSSVPRYGQSHLTAFSQGDAVWQSLLQCMREEFAPFDIQITDVDPGSAPHFEIMFGGTPQALGLSSSIGGISPFDCSQPYIPHSLVFVFDVWGSNVEELCATAAQEMAHSFRLDHCTDPSDPMTYYPYTGRRHFKDAQIQCGSDCVNGTSPFGQACTGTTQQNHACACTGSQTQDDVAVITQLFGAGAATPPSVRITSPQNGGAVTAGFPVVTEITDDTTVAKAELRVDGTLTQTLTAAPYVFAAPAALADGAHTILVTGYDGSGETGTAQIDVIVGPPCGKPADCPDTSLTCIGGRCVAAPGTPGGLGASCAAPTDCQSGVCADANGTKYCVESCLPGQCPSTFGCRDDGNGGGVCWPGFDEGGGGCTTGAPAGSITLGLLFAALLFRRRR